MSNQPTTAFDQRNYPKARGKFATGVVVITTRGSVGNLEGCDA